MFELIEYRPLIKKYCRGNMKKQVLKWDMTEYDSRLGHFLVFQ